MTISNNIKKDLQGNNVNYETVFQKHVVDGLSYFFKDVLQNSDEEYELRHDIAKATNTSINDVVIVGSAKLGFSVKTPDFIKFDDLYEKTKNIQDRSDIDIALVNNKYFEKVTEEIYHLSCHFNKEWKDSNWKTNQYHKNNLNNKKSLFKDYSLYIAKGWLRPDFMPNSYLTEAAWQEPCSKWQNKLNRDVNIGIYSNWTYLKYYHMDHLSTLHSKLESLQII